LALRALWPEPTWSSQSEPDNASYNIAPVIQPPYAARALFYAQRGLWPETTWPAQSAARIAPQTLIYGDQPPRLRGPQAFWPQVVWTAQSVSPNAGWNVAAPIVASVPPPIPQWHIWQAWQPVQAIAQGSGIGASWNIPAQVDNPPPQPAIQWHIWASWNSPPIPQQAVSLQQIDGIVSPQPIFPVLQPGPVDSPRIAEGAYRRKRKKLRRSLESKDPVFIAPASLERLPQAIIERVPDFTTLVRTLGETPAAVSARIDREIAQIIREQDEADDEDALLMILTALED
jgi:hypothetical protein